jgi:glycosyltransferase involved in cell wall biosynthesis
MKVSGFTFVRNAVKFDYPIVEAITSIMPLCDEIIVCVGKSDDDTLALIEGIGSDKIKIIHSVWDDSLREGGRVLAVETDKAFDAVSADSDWAFYIQGDEVVHEQYLPVIKKAMEKYKNGKNIEGLLFKYKHFYGSYDYVGDSRRWYRHEIRVIRNNKEIRSYRDAQGFRINGRKLHVKPIDAFIYHYGWVKPPKFQQAKMKAFNRMWHDDTWVDKNIPKVEEFDYSQVDQLRSFDGTHPEAMKKRIDTMNWKFDHDLSKNNFSFKERVLYILEKITGRRWFEYKNYKII